MEITAALIVLGATAVIIAGIVGAVCIWGKPEEKKAEEEQVKCEECKHWIDRKDAQEITRDRYSSILFYLMSGEREPDRAYYYCAMHKRPYESIIGSSYYKNIEVDETGVPTGYVKKNKAPAKKRRTKNKARRVDVSALSK